MARGRPQQCDISDDGHPCEAALEFRRAAVRFGAVDEVGADALDLAVSFAWIGKAVSRTSEAWPWIAAGTDPNTWLMVRAMASDSESRRVALRCALSASAIPGHEPDLRSLRKSRAFVAAADAVSRTVGHRIHPLDLSRLAELSAIARQIPGPEATRPLSPGANVVALGDFRWKKKGSL